MLRINATHEIEAKITRLLMEPTVVTDSIIDHCLIQNAHLKKEVGEGSKCKAAYEKHKCKSVPEEEAFVGEAKQGGVDGRSSSLEATQNDVASTPKTTLYKEGCMFIAICKGDEMEDILSMCDRTTVQVNGEDVGDGGRMSYIYFEKEIQKVA